MFSERLLVFVFYVVLPIPENGLGPRCLPGPNDTEKTPFGCQPWEGRNSGHCKPRPHSIACDFGSF